MKKAHFLLCLAVVSLRALANDSDSTPAVTPFVESTWPGIEMHIDEVKRIAGDRLLVGVSLQASSKAPPFTLIGTPGVHPPSDANKGFKIDVPPTPFSLQGSTMVEDRTNQKYNTVPPSSKPPFYRGSLILGSLSPGQEKYLTIQFPAPPPPPPDDHGIVPKQTVSILLPKARGPITKVVIPPPTLASP